MSIGERINERSLARTSVATMFAVLAILAGDIAICASRSTSARRASSRCATTTSASTAAATSTGSRATTSRSSRIILVADAFEAMTSDRPYRRAPGPEVAVAELRRRAGTQFDPEVVAALCRVLDRGGVGERADARSWPPGDAGHHRTTARMNRAPAGQTSLQP